MYILFSAHGSRRVASCTQFILYYFVGAGLSAPSSLWTARDCVLVPAVAITVFRLQIDASQHFKLRARSHQPVISVVSALSAPQPAAVSQPTAAIVAVKIHVMQYKSARTCTKAGTRATACRSTPRQGKIPPVPPRRIRHLKMRRNTSSGLSRYLRALVTGFNDFKHKRGSSSGAVTIPDSCP